MIFITNSYADISTNIYIEKNNNYVNENSNFDLAFSKNDNLVDTLKFRYNVNKGSYDYLDNVEVDLNFKNANFNCIDLYSEQNLSKLEIQSNKNNFNYIKSNVIKNKLCEFSNYALTKKTSKITSDESFDFDVNINKLLQKEVDYEVKVFAKDENNQLVEKKESGSIEIIRDEYGYSLQKQFNLNDCKDKAKSNFEYIHKFSIYLYKPKQSCYYQIKHEAYKNMPDRLVKFYDSNNVDQDIQKNEYYELTITSLLDKRIKDAGYYLNIYCEDDKGRDSIYNSWIKIDFNCVYDENLFVKNVTLDKNEINTNISFNNNNNTIELKNNNSVYLNNQINLSDSEQNQNSSTTTVKDQSFVETLFDFLFGWIYKYN